MSQMLFAIFKNAQEKMSGYCVPQMAICNWNNQHSFSILFIKKAALQANCKSYPTEDYCSNAYFSKEIFSFYILGSIYLIQRHVLRQTFLRGYSTVCILERVTAWFICCFLHCSLVRYFIERNRTSCRQEIHSLKLTCRCPARRQAIKWIWCFRLHIS